MVVISLIKSFWGRKRNRIWSLVTLFAMLTSLILWAILRKTGEAHNHSEPVVFGPGCNNATNGVANWVPGIMPYPAQQFAAIVQQVITQNVTIVFQTLANQFPGGYNEMMTWLFRGCKATLNLLPDDIGWNLSTDVVANNDMYSTILAMKLMMQECFAQIQNTTTALINNGTLLPGELLKNTDTYLRLTATSLAGLFEVTRLNWALQNFFNLNPAIQQTAQQLIEAAISVLCNLLSNGTFAPGIPGPFDQALKTWEPA